MKHEQAKSTLLDINTIINKLNISENMSVADLGCGTSGSLLFRCSELVGNNGKVYAVDILNKVLEIIKLRIKQENIKNIIPVWSNLEEFGATEIEPSGLDIAMFINTLFQSSKRAAMIRESVRLLKKDGKLLIIEWKNTSLPFGPPQKDRVDVVLLKNGATKLSLKLSEEFEAGQYHYALIFNKV